MGTRPGPGQPLPAAARLAPLASSAHSGKGGDNCHLGRGALVNRVFRSFILYQSIHVFIYVKASLALGMR